MQIPTDIQFLTTPMPPSYIDNKWTTINGKMTSVTAKVLRENGYAIPEHVQDGVYLQLSSYVDKMGAIRIDVTIPQHTMSLVNVEWLLEEKGK